MSQIEPMPVDKAVELYLEHRSDEVTENTVRSHEYRLKHVIRWADGRDDVGTTADLDGRKLLEYRKWRRKDGDLSVTSLHTQLTTVRVWVSFLEDIDAVEQNLSERIDVPALNGGEERDEVLPKDHAEQIDHYLNQFEYASRDHVLWTILYGVGVRLGGAHSLDIEDFDRDEQRLWFEHRPDAGTTLKNGYSGERPVSLSDHITTVIADYIDNVRPSVTDDHGRQPLIAGETTRPSKSTLRRIVYRWTQPCQIGADCPHNRLEAECDAAGYTNVPSGCPSIVSPHAIRKRTIIDYRKDEIPDKYISDRCNVSQQIMDKHYDVRTEEEKQEDRRDYFE
ncbi:tyrosine-type recombinase/integrase [Halosimplex litoreum]|uniref:Tyrosine-type recombinase/integrase n=1 Tax=Halosimplex litoreum TaxID=1198301 RepID=A0A7T3KW85_9EURY|nr:site-specific integrase [Halosimplex litoreum]QPV63894.1 tyrosine-type recombinase/integrase [Halosimplex litoreum]